MNSKKITESDISALKVSSLPTRPTAPAEFGGKGYTAAELKAAFDKLPLYIIENYNSLIEDICAPHGSSVSGRMLTGITNSHTLENLFTDILSGHFSDYLRVFDKTLTEFLSTLRADVDALKEGRT